jgi:hypothetical protein
MEDVITVTAVRAKDPLARPGTQPNDPRVALRCLTILSGCEPVSACVTAHTEVSFPLIRVINGDLADAVSTLHKSDMPTTHPTG